ncbi:MAG: 16S rRNA (adenine(1518)-N(6)/adenine(1519)-N(6))-dimethyltransferase RsmA [Smithellaceae bacterium]|nr:16S rRNA (adenine(1518)-N(6)/adenine(1519)-N(6))-dimethyltransferase RsmA [Smithellaceae bacterium]
MTTPGEILQRYRIRPDKRRGQSFLTDLNTIHKIAAAGKITREDLVVEIGAGFGVLTGNIAQRAGRLIAVEIDLKLVGILQKELAQCNQVEVFSGDILKFDFSCISKQYKSKIKVVGNIPYNISSPVVFHLLAHRRVIRDFTLMLQKEVVERLVSAPGRKSYGVPSVLLQMYADLKKLFDVPPGCFYPAPKITSSVMQGKFLEAPRFALEDEKLFNRLVRASFAQRRKMLANNLKQAAFLKELGEEDIASALRQAGIDGKRRGETLSVEEFGALSNFLKNQLTNRG